MDASPSLRIALLDQNPAFGALLKSLLSANYQIQSTANESQLIELVTAGGVDIVLINWDRTPANGHGDSPAAPRFPALMDRLAALPRSLPLLAFGWDPRRENALQFLRWGGTDFFPQPLDVQELRFGLLRAGRRLELMQDLDRMRALAPHCAVPGLLGTSKRMQRIHQMIHQVAPVSTSVLITGESGTGKELAARAIHQLSPRAMGPFVAFSICALNEALIEDELFGHAKGAFTGALQPRVGRFEEAQGGTIFLDEIGDLALALQPKLLRVLQDRTLQRLGSNQNVALDVRVICATNRPLDALEAEQRFRRDLFFRIAVVRIELPPLRERIEDIPLLAGYFLRQYAARYHRPARSMSPGYLCALAGYDWPGNVRQLQNIIERGVVLSEAAELGVKDLPPEIRPFAAAAWPGGSFHQGLRAFKREMVRKALRLHGGNKLRAARELQISRGYLHRLLRELEMSGEEALAPPPAAAESQLSTA